VRDLEMKNAELKRKVWKKERKEGREV